MDPNNFPPMAKQIPPPKQNRAAQRPSTLEMASAVIQKQKVSKLLVVLVLLRIGQALHCTHRVVPGLLGSTQGTEKNMHDSITHIDGKSELINSDKTGTSNNILLILIHHCLQLM